jgi:hypothetical protein
MLLLSAVVLFTMTAGCGGGSSTVNPATSLVTITVGGNGKSACISIEKNTFFARSGFFVKKFFALAGSAFATIPAGVTEIDFTITAPEAGFQTQSRKVPVVPGQANITEQFVVSNGNNRHFLIEAKDASGNVTYTGENNANLDGVPVTIGITMSATLVVTTKSLPAATVGSAYSQTLAAGGGTAPYTWSISVGALPAGLILNMATGVITGTPTTEGTVNFTVMVTDSASPAGTATGALSIMTAPATLVVTTTSLPTATVGTAYSQALAAGGGTAPYTWSISVGALPAGLSLNAATGIINGTPTTAGTSAFTAQVKDASGATATGNLSITISTLLSVTTASLPGGYVASPYNQTLAAANGLTPYSWSITSGSLPPGLTLNASTGAITGTPTTAGTSAFTVQVKDANGATATENLSITISTLLSVTTASLPGDDVNTPYNQTLAAANGLTPYSWSITSGSLPPGLNLSASTGAITGTPTTAGTSAFTVQVKDASGATATKNLSITISALPIVTTASPLPGVDVNTPYNQTLAATNGLTPYSWSITSGSLPPGLNLSASTGAITGTPTTVGASTFTVQVKDANGATATKNLSITIDNGGC